MQRPMPAGPPAALVPGSELPLALARVVERAYETVVFAAEVSFSGDVGNPKRWSAGLVQPCVEFGAQRDQVLFDVAPRMTVKFEVVHLHALHATATLASQPIALQHHPIQFTIGRRIRSQSWRFAAAVLLQAFPGTPGRKASCC